MNAAIWRHPIKLALAMLLAVLQFPLQVVFYFIQSAWADAWRVGQWFRPELICEHGIDRNRAPCDDCNTREEQELMAAFNATQSGATN
jgi:hypothetical protein